MSLPRTRRSMSPVATGRSRNREKSGRSSPWWITASTSKIRSICPATNFDVALRLPDRRPVCCKAGSGRPLDPLNGIVSVRLPDFGEVGDVRDMIDFQQMFRPLLADDIVVGDNFQGGRW